MGSQLIADSNASLYGSGIFTTIAIRNGLPLFWEKHWRRLKENAAKIGLELSAFSDKGVRSSLGEAIVKATITNGRARITFFDESLSPLWSIPEGSKTGLAIITGEHRTIPKNFKLTVSPFSVNSRSPLVGVKSCNYLENILVLDDAKRRGFNEAVRLNENGHLTSTCMANIFWLKGGRLYTPSLSTGCLAGTTREFVLENVECEEVKAGINELNGADAIYLTSAGLGVAAVAEFDGREFNSAEHPILNILPAWR